MSDTEYKRLLDTAKERAFFGFLALIQRAMQDADKTAATLQAGATSNLGQSALLSLRHFLRQDGNALLRRMESLLRSYLERAMQTMYVDMRPGLHNLSADGLSLIDDEVINHQIEVGRLAQRMRDADEEGIGRLNVIVARMHGKHEAKERENPFRPYLLARVLYEAVRESEGDEAKARLLFEHLANALIPHLPGYYGAIRLVFESSGVHGKFIAQQSRAAHFQRYYGAPPADANTLSAQFSSRVLPGLQRMVEALQPAAGAQGAAQDLIRAMLSSARSANAFSMADGSRGVQTAERENLRANLASPLVAQLNAYQKKVAQGEPIEEGQPQEPNQLFALRDRLNLDTASTPDRMTIEVVGMLFEFMLDDEQLSARSRTQIGRLQIPILKAALLDAALMHDAGHAARRLLNRLASAAVAVDPDSRAGRQLDDEIERVVNKILREFGSDVTIFAACLAQFEEFLARHLRRDDERTAHGIEALENAEKISILLTNVTTELCNLLVPMNVDKRISDFIIHVWPHVLVRAAWTDRESKVSGEHPDSAFLKYRAVLPDLLWSIQEKQNPQDRAALMRLLPDLVRRLNQALQLIQLPEDESRRIMDQLVAMHTQVLRGPQKEGAAQATRQELEQNFARLAINWERVSWPLPDPPQPRADLIEEVVARHGVQAALRLGASTVAATAADKELLAQTCLLGTRVEIRAGEEEVRSAQLVWISTRRSLYLFRQDDGELLIYTSAALLEALREATMVPLEYAPVFERAVESLLFGAEKIRVG